MVRFIIFVLFVMGCSDVVDLKTPCPGSCYTGARDTENRGECRSGKPKCAKDTGEVLSCEDEALPSDEVCDNLDNDCNGVIDNMFSRPPSKNECKQCGVCNHTVAFCVGGNWVCDYPNPLPDTETVCNGKDDDCDCRTDEPEDLYGDNEICYNGPPRTVLRGKCLPGLRVCQDGREKCLGEVMPTPEQCNEIDDDCNGLVDDETENYQGVDMVLAIDVSGSMEDKIATVAELICDYSAIQSQNQYMFSLVQVSFPEDSWTLSQDLDAAGPTCSALNNFGVGGGAEPMISAVGDIASPDNPLGISWRPGARRVIIGFSDEDAQVQACSNHSDVCFDDGKDLAVQNCTATNTLIYWFTFTDFGYSDVSNGCGGACFQLSSSPDRMLRDLNTIISDICFSE